MMLEDAGYEVRWHRVQGAEEMELALSHGAWDVVLCDHVMPRFDSFAALGVLSRSAAARPSFSSRARSARRSRRPRSGPAPPTSSSKEHLGRLASVVRTQLLDAEHRRSQRAAEEQFRCAFEDAPFGSALIALSGDAGSFLRVNRALCESTGYRREELLDFRVGA